MAEIWPSRPAPGRLFTLHCLPPLAPLSHGYCPGSRRRGNHGHPSKSRPESRPESRPICAGAAPLAHAARPRRPLRRPLWPRAAQAAVPRAGALHRLRCTHAPPPHTHRPRPFPHQTVHNPTKCSPLSLFRAAGSLPPAARRRRHGARPPFVPRRARPRHRARAALARGSRAVGDPHGRLSALFEYHLRTRSWHIEVSHRTVGQFWVVLGGHGEQYHAVAVAAL